MQAVLNGISVSNANPPPSRILNSGTSTNFCLGDGEQIQFVVCTEYGTWALEDR